MKPLFSFILLYLPFIVTEQPSKATSPRIILSIDPEAYVTWHNAYRCLHNSPPVVWDEALARSAQKWTDTCNGRHTSNLITELGQLNENLWAYSAFLGTAQEVVGAWYNEIKDPGYTFAKGGYQFGAAHFTQIIWASTTKIGCAACKNADTNYVVCQYSPGGNGPGFSRNVLLPLKSPSQCFPKPSPSNCVDSFPDWHDYYGQSCASYASNHWCVGGAVGEGWTYQFPISAFSNPDFDDTSALDACCVCGGGKKLLKKPSPSPPPLLPPSPSPPPSPKKPSPSPPPSPPPLLPPPPSPPPSPRVVLPIDPNEYVTWHNAFRCLHNSPPVVWDEALARSAQKWTDTCNGRHTDDLITDLGQLNENLWGHSNFLGTAQEVIGTWYEQIRDPGYDFNKGGFQLGRGHFTQVIWASTTKIGCAACRNTDTNWRYVVCQYSPGGNGPGFLSNIFRPLKTESQCFPQPSPSNCVDSISDWVDFYGQGCAQYASEHFCVDGALGEGWPSWAPSIAEYWDVRYRKSAYDVCCVCGGGTKSSSRSLRLSPSPSPRTNPGPLNWLLAKLSEDIMVRSPKASKSPSPMVSVSPIPKVSSSPSPKISASPSPKVSASPSMMVSSSHSPMASVSPSPMASTSRSPTASAIRSPMASGSHSPILSSSHSPMASASPSMSTSESADPSPSPMVSDSPSPIFSEKPSSSRSRRIPNSRRPSRSPSRSPTASAAPIWGAGAFKSPRAFERPGAFKTAPGAGASTSPWASTSSKASTSPGTSKSPIRSPSPMNSATSRPEPDVSPSISYDGTPPDSIHMESRAPEASMSSNPSPSPTPSIPSDQSTWRIIPSSDLSLSPQPSGLESPILLSLPSSTTTSPSPIPSVSHIWKKKPSPSLDIDSAGTSHSMPPASAKSVSVSPITQPDLTEAENSNVNMSHTMTSTPTSANQIPDERDGTVAKQDVIRVRQGQPIWVWVIIGVLVPLVAAIAVFLAWWKFRHIRLKSLQMEKMTFPDFYVDPLHPGYITPGGHAAVEGAQRHASPLAAVSPSQPAVAHHFEEVSSPRVVPYQTVPLA